MGVRGKKTLAGRETAETVNEKPKRGKGNFNKRVVEAAKEGGVEVGGLTMKEQEAIAAQASLGVEAPERPQTVRGRMMMAEYTRPHFEVEKGERMVSLEFSFPLTPEHKELLPKMVEEAWKFIRKDGCKSMVLVDIPPQTVDVRLAPDMEPEFHLTGAAVSKASLSLVEETGSGKTERVVRFLFRVQCERTRDVVQFATTHDGDSIWIEMDSTQGSLL